MYSLWQEEPTVLSASFSRRKLRPCSSRPARLPDAVSPARRGAPRRAGGGGNPPRVPRDFLKAPNLSAWLSLGEPRVSPRPGDRGEGEGVTLTTHPHLPILKIIFFSFFFPAISQPWERFPASPPPSCAGGGCSILPPGLDGLLSRCRSNGVCTKTPCISPNSVWVWRSAGRSLRWRR